MRITYIHLNNEKVTIQYEKRNESTKGWDSFSIDSKDDPLDSFANEIGHLSKSVVKINRFPHSYEEDITVVGLALKYDKNDYYKCIISAHRQLPEGRPHICHTPLTPVVAEDENAYTVDQQTASIIEKVCLEAQRYINGERKQQTIEFDEKEKEKTGTKNMQQALPMGVEDTGETLRGDIRKALRIADYDDEDLNSYIRDAYQEPCSNWEEQDDQLLQGIWNNWTSVCKNMGIDTSQKNYVG